MTEKLKQDPAVMMRRLIEQANAPLETIEDGSKATGSVIVYSPEEKESSLTLAEYVPETADFVRGNQEIFDSGYFTAEALLERRKEKRREEENGETLSPDPESALPFPNKDFPSLEEVSFGCLPKGVLSKTPLE